ncbi:hypothetical protein HanPI659440_Chr02g0089681 [Helianthus annuus]|nr:hypothetical protein HanPI659440_Chr02g0089681 [Helianthus annuus]
MRTTVWELRQQFSDDIGGHLYSRICFFSSNFEDIAWIWRIFLTKIEQQIYSYMFIRRLCSSFARFLTKFKT